MTSTVRAGAGRHRSVALFCMPETGHFQRLRSLISDLAKSGVAAHVFTHRRFAPQVERSGGVFIDLFSPYPIEAADNTSFPVPCRYVTYAAQFADAIVREVEKTAPSLVIHDSFAVIGRVIADRLRLPRVNICSGHNVTPGPFVDALARHPRAKPSPECIRAAAVLRDVHGIADASPFAYVASPSEDLNLYCEPPQFLEPEERAAFRPLAFYGSIPGPDAREPEDPARRSRFPAREPGLRKVYVSFGTVVWRWYPEEARRTLQVLSAAFARMRDVQVVMSLGGAPMADAMVKELLRPNVQVDSYVDQWRLLQEADAVVTHHGLNSSHEAIFHGVPMLSCPFFWDQPALATKCQSFGLAVPLAYPPRAPLDDQAVHDAMARLHERREGIAAALAQAKAWETAVIAERPAVLRLLHDLAG